MVAYVYSNGSALFFLRKYQDIKEKHLKANKVDRLYKSEWKYGLIGGSNPHSSHTTLSPDEVMKV
jgi:hypothetical protein